jgi:hypothetical protein
MKRTIFYSFLILLAFASCREKIDLDLPSDSQKLVVAAEISAEADSSFVKLSRTIQYPSPGTNPVVDDALVLVSRTGSALKDTFKYDAARMVYLPKPGFKGDNTSPAGVLYDLYIKTTDGREYTSQTRLDRMFRISGNDSVFPIYKERNGPIDAGWTINYWFIYEGMKTHYVFFRFGFNGEKSMFRDSTFDNVILFDSRATVRNQWREFELPFLRLLPKDSAFAVFKSVDETVYQYYMTFNEQTQGAPGPFKSPSANLPTNINGGAVGYFMAYDVRRLGKRIP